MAVRVSCNGAGGAEDVSLTVDPRPGNYYVSVVDAGRLGLLLGPFSCHQDALDNVEAARTQAYKADPWAWFYNYGTVRMAAHYVKPGLFNRRMGQ